MKIIMSLVLSIMSSIVYAMPCSETPESKNEIELEIKKVNELDSKGEEAFQKSLNNLQKVSKKDDKQMSIYALQVATKPEFEKLQQERQMLALKMLTLISGNDCKALKENNKKLQSVISTQWLGALAAVQADTQMYLAKNISNAPDMKATTDSGKKVILHANGTWAEELKK